MEIHPICNLSITARVVELAGGGDELRVAWMKENIGRGLAALERMLGDPRTGTFCHGDTPTMADICLVPQIYNARRWGVDLEAMPRIVEIDAACNALDAFALAHPDKVNAPAA
jgi:maleylacetoacetate isomerase